MNLRAEHLRQVVAGAPVAPTGPVAKRLVRTLCPSQHLGQIQAPVLITTAH